MPRAHDRRCPHRGRPRFTRSPAISSSYRNRLLRPLPPPPPPPIVNDGEVIGSVNPDCTGLYDVAGSYNGKPYLRRLDGAFFIWWKFYAPTNRDEWRISTVLGNIGSPNWQKYTFFPADWPGAYVPGGGGVSGNPTAVAL